MKKPRYREIEEDLLDKIKSGVYEEGAIIPKEIELTLLYGVSRPTVRQAVQNLVNLGYLQRIKRLGTIVKRHKVDQEFTQIIESFDSEQKRKGLEPKTIVISFQQDIANEEVAKKLQLTLRDEVYKLIRLRYTQGQPVVLVTTYIPKRLLPNLDQYDFTSESLYQVLKKENYPVLRIKRILDVLIADETTADLLGVDIGDPLFYFHSIGFSDNQIPVEYSISKYRGDTNSFVFEIVNQPT